MYCSGLVEASKLILNFPESISSLRKIPYSHNFYQCRLRHYYHYRHGRLFVIIPVLTIRPWQELLTYITQQKFFLTVISLLDQDFLFFLPSCDCSLYHLFFSSFFSPCTAKFVKEPRFSSFIINYFLCSKYSQVITAITELLKLMCSYTARLQISASFSFIIYDS